MKHVIGAITLVIGLFVDFVAFTEAGSTFLRSNYGRVFGIFQHNVLLVLSAVALGVAIYNLIKNKEKILSILSIISNFLYLGYFILLFISFGA